VLVVGQIGFTLILLICAGLFLQTVSRQRLSPTAPGHDIFVDVFMPTTVHIPAALLKSVDRRAKALGVSRNRLIVRALEQAVSERPGWAPEFLERLRNVNRETGEAVDALLVAVKQARGSKAPPEL
jgi:predicted transcriptional regulator